MPYHVLREFILVCLRITIKLRTTATISEKLYAAKLRNRSNHN